MKYEIKIYLSRTFDVGEEEEVLAEEPEMIFAEDSNNEQSEFDTIVGCIEDIVIGEKFQDLQVFFKYFTVNMTEVYISFASNLIFYAG